MKYYFLFLLILILTACSKDNDSAPTDEILTPCTIYNEGIFTTPDPNPSSPSYSKNNFTIDSVVLTSNIFTLWFTEDASGEKMVATLKRYDHKDFRSGTYYFLDSTNTSFSSSYATLTYPAVFFDVKSVGSVTNAFYLYDKYVVCISNDDGKFGVFIDGMKIADTRSGNPSLFLTFSLENEDIISY